MLGWGADPMSGGVHGSLDERVRFGVGIGAGLFIG